ncbi:hypothetical protein VIGAN_07002700 [Vigna angularis var. angularis]|uniref:Uncharacterized protein n=1 Tax=Vigna angularis var. angularis TaxID=157739 RepID=A0A0S3SF37_PHAAN|nr:hypothetical protein VIGAN_07002700 [Vigna angularis var. angularis]
MGCLGRVSKDRDAGPVNSVVGVRARPNILKLDVGDFVGGLVGHGLPTFRIDDGVNVRVEDGDGGIGSQGTPKARMHLSLSVLILRRHSEFASLETEPAFLIRILSRLSRERHVLSVPRVHHAVLEHRRCAAVDEVHRAVDIALFVELTPGNRPQCVLESFDGALEEYALVCLVPNRHCTACVQPCPVRKSHLRCHEPISTNVCKPNQPIS